MPSTDVTKSEAASQQLREVQARESEASASAKVPSALIFQTHLLQ
jgi:hypothetical protein